MIIKCIIIDDEPLAISLIETHLAKIPNMEVIAKCNNAIEAFSVLKSQQVDLMFLDIQMPLLTGMEFLKSLNNSPKVILTTAYREYAIESYEFDVVDYLLKPIAFDRFFKAINKFFKTIELKENSKKTETPESNNKNFIVINVNKKLHKVLFSEILYAESLKDYVQVHTKDKSISTKFKISDFEKKLPNNFLRIHRSYIVNIDKITAFTAHDIEIDTIEIPIGISYKKQVVEKLKIEF
ncbi:LytR/AlgR family response regulator transcription factor [Seonamhaeicola marinus]|uniref:Response regulator transcription factor n=1 Tax=Seonamhaeicola marinus TaxID=1912246 RepID=A0A5D0HK17_9FLAO|nr:LytTR family DNA-binding domain-containing protein [Seonamhaeicola marinus]TYA71595.1 response regulator transcription factor [Seonamhaeicola marinus]